MMSTYAFGEIAIEAMLNVPIYDPGLLVQDMLLLPRATMLLLYRRSAALEPKSGTLPRMTSGFEDV